MKRRSTSAWPGFTAAAVLHAGLLGVLFLSDPPEPQAAVRKPPVRVRVIERRPPPPAPRPEPEVAPAPKPEPRPAVQKKRPRRKPIEKPVLVDKLPTAPPPVAARPEVKAEPAPTPAAEPAPANQSPAAPRTPRRFTVAMSATVASGGVAVPTAASGAGWAFGSRDGDPDAERALAGPAAASAGAGAVGRRAATLDASAVTALPRLVEQPSFREMRDLYPELARNDGLEADVSLKILVSTGGEVVKVRVLRPAGNGFDEAAEELVRRFRFSPGKRGEEPVAVWIPWTYRFRLEG